MTRDFSFRYLDRCRLSPPFHAAFEADCWFSRFHFDFLRHFAAFADFLDFRHCRRLLFAAIIRC